MEIGFWENIKKSKYSYDEETSEMYCSICKCNPFEKMIWFSEWGGMDINHPMKFCPNCGASMRIHQYF